MKTQFLLHLNAYSFVLLKNCNNCEKTERKQTGSTERKQTFLVLSFVLFLEMLSQGWVFKNETK